MGTVPRRWWPIKPESMRFIEKEIGEGRRKYWTMKPKEDERADRGARWQRRYGAARTEAKQINYPQQTVRERERGEGGGRGCVSEEKKTDNDYLLHDSLWGVTRQFICSIRRCYDEERTQIYACLMICCCVDLESNVLRFEEWKSGLSPFRNMMHQLGNSKGNMRGRGGLWEYRVCRPHMRKCKAQEKAEKNQWFLTLLLSG